MMNQVYSIVSHYSNSSSFSSIYPLSPTPYSLFPIPYHQQSKSKKKGKESNPLLA